jgi:hypothetical protein
LAPRQQELIKQEMRAIEEQTRKSNSAHVHTVRPAVETLIHVSKRRETNHV